MESEHTLLVSSSLLSLLSTQKAETNDGAVAQMGERLLCKQEVTGSIPVSSTNALKTKPVLLAWMSLGH